MKHLVLLAAMVLAAVPQPAEAPSAPSGISATESAETECIKPGERRAEAPGPVRARPLGELPPGQLELAVLRTVDGCVRRAVLRENVGGTRLPDEGLGR